MNAARNPVASVHRLFEEIPENGHLPVKWTALRCWAAKNAYTLIFLSACFIITWTVQVLTAVIK
jgi:hypothetical protein